MKQSTSQCFKTLLILQTELAVVQRKWFSVISLVDCQTQVYLGIQFVRVYLYFSPPRDLSFPYILKLKKQNTQNY